MSFRLVNADSLAVEYIFVSTSVTSRAREFRNNLLCYRLLTGKIMCQFKDFIVHLNRIYCTDEFNDQKHEQCEPYL